MDVTEQKKWEWRQGYDYAFEKFKAEIERLKKENAELREALANAKSSKQT